MLNDKPRLVRAEIAKHVQKIKLAPIGRTYIASGTGIYSGVWLLEWCRGPGLHHAYHGV
jgi:hypothetical protein